MIKGVTRPSIFYDLVGLAHAGVVTVGRESDSTIRLDCPEVPFLLSRKHARVCVEPDGQLVLRDQKSTNGTYVAREGEFLRRLRPDENWVLQRNDVVGFGGPETIVARSETPDITVANPFLFRYTPLDDESDNSSAEPQAVLPAAAGQVQARARKFSELEDRSSELQDMECEVVSTSSPGQDHKKAKTSLTGKDVAALLSNHLTCAICHDWLAGAHALTCGHMFCGICLAGWLAQKQSCPECRNPTAGVPVACRGVDHSVSDILEHNLVSPNTKRERRRKQMAWEEVGKDVVDSWRNALQQRRQQATNTAAQHLSNLTGAAPAAVPAAPASVPALQPTHNTRRAQGGAAPAGRQGR